MGEAGDVFSNRTRPKDINNRRAKRIARAIARQKGRQKNRK